MLFIESEQGQGLAEYGMVIVLAAIVVVAIVTILGPQIGNVYSRITYGFTIS